MCSRLSNLNASHFIEFIKVQGEGFQEIPEWQSVPNLKYMSIKKFKEFID